MEPAAAGDDEAARGGWHPGAWSLHKGDNRALLADAALTRRLGDARAIRIEDPIPDQPTSQELLTSAEYLRAALDSSAGGFYGVDTEGVTTVCNNAFLTMLGFARMEDVVGRKLHDVIHHTHPDGSPYPKEECPIYRAASTGIPSHVEEELFFRLDGTSFPVEYWTLPIVRDGQLCGAVTTFLDISARKAAARELLEARGRLEAALMAGEIGTFVWDVVSDRMYGDPNFQALFGISLREGIAPLSEFVAAIHPDDRERTISLVGQSLETGRDYQTEYRIISCDPERWVSARGKVERDANGQAVRFPGVLVDITERKRAEQARELSELELRRGREALEVALVESQTARAAAEEASRLKDEFLATLSHELRTPLNAILGWAQVLRRRNIDDEKTREGFSVIERNARVQVQLIEDLLDMSRIVAGQLRLDVQRVDLAEVIKAALDSVRPAAEAKGIRIQVVLDSHAGPVRGDIARLQQVAWNLLSNALKFTPKGGRVMVAVERVNSHIELTVTDNGIGIAPDFLPHVFERFRQGDGSSTRRYQGLGLGLGIVKNLVEMHGGKVRVKSAGHGRGASFSVELPLMVMNEGEPSARTHPRAPAWDVDGELTDDRLLEDIVVLVVDDEKDARDLIGHLLEECGGRAITAGSADEAFELIRSQRPHVLLSDVGMPEEDGYSLMRRVRALAAHEGGTTPAVALTAFARSEDRRKALIAGFQAHVAKPVEPSELIAVVASLAGKIGVGSRKVVS